MLKTVVFLYAFHIVYTGVFTGVMISAILLKINYIRGLYVMNELVKEIEQLKKEKNAVILAHYYVNDEVQEIADYIGDSYYLAKVAREVDAKTIVFCGVSFMGESAKILNPNKTILMPDMSADCPMAHMAQVEKIEEMREKYDDLAVVCYINSTAELKCHSDVCVTSSNAVKIVKSLPNKNIFFIPDENLGRHVAKQIPEKNIILNKGFCHVHVSMTADNLKAIKEKYPKALVLAHPECKQEVLDLADYIGSTSGIINYATESDNEEFIICTESGVGYELRTKNPNKKFYFAGTKHFCPNMKLNTVEKVCHVLKTGENEVHVSLIAFCKGIQAAAPVDSYVDPEPWDMPGYDSQVIMAAGAFVQGSSIELSADGPVKPPYAVYFQGGLTWEHAKLGVLMSLQKLVDANIVTLP